MPESTDKSWFVYMVETEKGRLYTGISTDIERRFKEHLATHQGTSSRGAKYFRSDRPLRVVYQELQKNRALASQRESALKKLSASQKKALVSSLSV